MKRRTSAALFLLVTTAKIGGASARSPEPPTPAAQVIQPRSDGKGRGAPFSLTLSGGISLGAYEAGLNWALLEWLKTKQDAGSPEGPLMGVSGASAGAINALLSAMRWCEKIKSTTIDDNLFSKTWREVGIDDPHGLLGATRDKYVEVASKDPQWDPDFIISRRNAFTPVFERVKTALEAPAYSPGCRVRLSLMVTKAQPRRINVEGLTTRSQRLVMPLMMVVDEKKRAHFILNRELLNDDQQRSLIGEVILPAPTSAKPDATISTEEVVKAVMASSAHPSSFGPVLLRHCTAEAWCPHGMHVKSEDAMCAGVADILAGGGDQLGKPVMCAEPFVDGGAFDNVPLGMAMAQAESAVFPSGRPRTSLPVHYIYLDPGVRRTTSDQKCKAAGASSAAGRGKGDEPPDSPQPRRDPITELVTFVGGMYSSASEYELHNVLRFNRWNLTPARVAKKVRTTTTDICHRAARADQACAALEAKLQDLEGRAVALEHQTEDGDAQGWLEALPTFIDTAKAVISSVEPSRDPGRADCEHLKRELDDLHDVKSGRELQIPTRFPPITGALLAHFAAFLDRPFRDYDYYAGLYDGVAAVADWNCKGCGWEKRRAVIEQWMGLLGVTATDGPVKKLLGELLDREDEFTMNRAPEAVCSDAAHPAARDEARLKVLFERLEQIRASLEDPSRCGYHTGVCLLDENFKGLLTNLASANYRADSDVTKQAVASPDDWWTDPASRAVNRLEHVNDHETLDSGVKAGIGIAAKLGSLVTQHWYNLSHDDWYFRPLSNASSPLARFFSPSVAIATTSERYSELGVGNYAFGFRNAVLAGEGAFRFGTSEDGDRPRFSSLNLAGGPSFPTESWFVSSINVRAERAVVDLWGTVPRPVSYELGVGLFLNHIRFSGGLDCEDWAPTWKHKYFKLAISDIAGLLEALY